MLFSEVSDNSEYGQGLYNVIFKIEERAGQEEEIDPDMVCDIEDACETTLFGYGFFCHENWHTEDWIVALYIFKHLKTDLVYILKNFEIR